MDKTGTWPNGGDGQSAGKTHNVGGDEGDKAKQSLIRRERDLQDCLPRWPRRAALVREHQAEAYRK